MECPFLYYQSYLPDVLAELLPDTYERYCQLDGNTGLICEESFSICEAYKKEIEKELTVEWIEIMRLGNDFELKRILAELAEVTEDDKMKKIYTKFSKSKTAREQLFELYRKNHPDENNHL